MYQFIFFAVSLFQSGFLFGHDVQAIAFYRGNQSSGSGFIRVCRTLRQSTEAVHRDNHVCRNRRDGHEGSGYLSLPLEAVVQGIQRGLLSTFATLNG